MSVSTDIVVNRIQVDQSDRILDKNNIINTSRAAKMVVLRIGRLMSWTFWTGFLGQSFQTTDAFINDRYVYVYFQVRVNNPW